jgi:hypothetical protein
LAVGSGGVLVVDAAVLEAAVADADHPRSVLVDRKVGRAGPPELPEVAARPKRRHSTCCARSNSRDVRNRLRTRRSFRVSRVRFPTGWQAG